MIGIYKITSPSGKVYIGQSWDIDKRFNDYKHLNCKNQRKLYYSLNHYGYDSHKFEIIKIVSNDVSQEALNNLEIFYIQQQKEWGYELINLKEGGKGGGKHSQETKDIIGKLKKGKPGHPHTEKFKKDLTERNKKRIYKKGFKRSKENIKNMSDGMKKFYSTEEGKAVQSKRTLGRKPSKETKEKQSKKRIEYWKKIKANG